MIENRSRRWSFQFIILPLLRDDSWVLKSSRLWVEGGAEKSRVMPTELRELEGLGRKITVFRKPSGIPKPRHTRERELVHSDHVHGQTSWRAGKAFDKPWKSSYNFSTRLFNPNPLVLGLQCATTAKSEDLRRIKHHTSLF